MSTRDIVYVALFAALTAALGLFPPLMLPVIGVPVTAQTMGVMLAGALAGSRRGGLALLLFVVLVAIGLPLLAGGRGGLGVFLGPSGGFVLAFPIAAFATGWLIERRPGMPGLPVIIGSMAAGGIGVIYLVGIPWLAIAGGLPLATAATGVIGFVPGDVAKVVLAALITQGVRRAYPAP